MATAADVGAAPAAAPTPAQRRAEVDAAVSQAKGLAASFLCLARGYDEERDAAARAGLDRGAPMYGRGLGVLAACAGQLAGAGLIGGWRRHCSEGAVGGSPIAAARGPSSSRHARGDGPPTSGQLSA
jgi:hypothetical protein